MALDIWLAFTIASLLISLSPGAGAINTMSMGFQYGLKGSLPAILGLQLGYGIQIALVALGLGTLIASSTILFSLIKWAGVFYLLWLGYKKWTLPTAELTFTCRNSQSGWRLFTDAALVNLINPKATIFLLALFPQFIDYDSGAHPGQFLIMGATLITCDILVMSGYAGFASHMAQFMSSARQQRIQNRLFGSLFIAAASFMAGISAS